MFIWITISRQIIKKSFFSHMCGGFVLHQKRTFSLNHNMNSGLFSLHHYVTNQCIWLVQRTSSLLFFSSKPLTLLLSHHFIYARYTAPVSFPPASLFLLILCHLPPSSFSAICLHSVCASRKFPLRLWGELRFSLLRSSLVLLLYVFRAGKASSSCMQQGVCSVCGCPIRDPTVWCYNLSIQRDPLSICLSLWLLFSLFLYEMFLPLFSFLSLTTLSPSPPFSFLICLCDSYPCHFPPYTTYRHSLSLSLSLPPLTLTYLKWLLFPVYLTVFLYSFLALDGLVAKEIQILVVLPPPTKNTRKVRVKIHS